ncbi:MAG: hypothetical protein V7745_02830 [Pseudomonadales bacterium]
MEYALGFTLGVISTYLLTHILRRRALRFRNANIGTPDPEFDEICDRFVCLYKTDGTTRFGLSPRKK